MLIWPTVVEQKYHAHNVNRNLETECPTAKTGVIGGGAFLSLDSCLMWLVALMLAYNVREDYFEESGNKAVISHGSGDVPIKNAA